MTDKKLNYLVCVNYEKYSEVAMHFACKIAQKNNGSVIILHVMEPADYQTIGAIAEKMQQEQRQDAEELLNNLSAKAQKWSEITPVIMLREGLVENEIISLVEDDKSINMLIVGAASSESHPKSKILPPLVASLGSKLQIPMMIIPGNLTTGQIDKMA